MAKKDSHEIRKEKAKKYIKKNMLKQVLKQKLYELGIIPVGLSIIVFIPYWIGLLLSKILGEEIFLKVINAGKEETLNSISFGYHWVHGLLVLVILGAFIWANITFAKYRLEKKAADKFNVRRWDL